MTSSPIDTDYQRFIQGKLRHLPPSGMASPPRLSAFLSPFQVDAVTRALSAGRYGLYEDCGLGKTAQELEWAHRVAEHTGRPVLILAPLAVGQQTVREGVKFNLPCRYARTMAEADPRGVTVTNYERLDAFDTSAFAGVAVDESGILRAYEGSMRRAITNAFARTPYRLAASATPAPNTHMELGTQCEFLGVLSSHEMLARWFINDTSTMGTYRLKGHAVADFWAWVSSWSACIGRPSDLGDYSDAGYVLPELVETLHTLDVDTTQDRAAGNDGQFQLFRMGSKSATNLHREKRITLTDRARKVAELVTSEPGESWLVWVDTDYEDDEMRSVLPVVGARAFAAAAKAGGALPAMVSVRGSDTLDDKERALLAFADGSIRVLVTKGKIAQFGLNWQHAARMVDIGVNFSYDSLYQRRRRMWRFGQKRPVHHHIVMASTEVDVWNTVQRKAADHERMKVAMFAAMRAARAAGDASAKAYSPRHVGRLPEWLAS